MEPWLLVLCVGIGIVTGFINSLAGSGSLITLPFFIFMGLPPTEANGTNRVGILLQSMVSTYTIQRRTRMSLQGSGFLIWPCVAGAVVGGLLAAFLDDKTMGIAIGVVMILMIGPVLLNSQRWVKQQEQPLDPKRKPWIGALYFILGIYGGFIQAGVGLFLLTTMVLLANYPLPRANLLKNLIVLIFTIPVISIFIWKGDVNWLLGALMATGQATGGWIAARLSVRSTWAARLSYWLVVAMLLASAVKMFLG